ncbi:hypothetical protein ACWGJB_32915 [Streptomyces sp. NPDC054813]
MSLFGPAAGDRPLTPSPYWARTPEAGPEWVALPAGFRGTPWADEREYADAVGSALVVLHERVDPGGELRTRVADTVLDTYERLLGMFPAHYHLLHWPDLDRPPVPVFLALWQPEPEPEPEAEKGPAARFFPGDDVEYVAREESATEHLGAGTRLLGLLRLGPEDPAGLLGVAVYHWRTTTRPTDVHFLALTHELGRLYAVLPALDAFAREIALTDDPTAE